MELLIAIAVVVAVTMFVISRAAGKSGRNGENASGSTSSAGRLRYGASRGSAGAGRQSGRRKHKPQPKHPQPQPQPAKPVNWRPRYQEIKKAYIAGGELNVFIAGVDALMQVKPPSATINEMLRDAAQAVAKADKTLALTYYLRARVMGCTKELNKHTQAILFPEERIRFKFESILEFYRSSGDANETKRQLLTIYDPERRQIQIDKNDLRVKEREFKETTDLLGGLLAEDTGDTVGSPDARGQGGSPDAEAQASRQHFPESAEPVGTRHVVPATADAQGIGNIDWTAAESALLKAFEDAGGELAEEQVELLARSLGMMPSMLIDGINEKYVEMTDHPLIEEADGIFALDK